MSEIDDLLSGKTKLNPEATAHQSDIDRVLDSAPKQGRGALGFARDAGVALAKGVIGVPEAVVGMADLVTGGQAGKLAEGAGVRFKDAKDALSELYTPEQKAANKEVNDAKGFMPTVGAMLKNPSTIVDSAIESAPSMLAGGAVSRGALALAPKLSPILAGAIGEGATAAGQNAEQVRQEDPNGTLTAGQSAVLAASGAVTGGIGFGAGRLANKLGIGDVQTMLASGKLGAVGENAIATGASKGFIRKAAEGTAVEGALQELPQSYQEQVAQNVAQGKPWDEGAAAAGAQGMLAGGLMGGVGGSFNGEAAHSNVPAPTNEQPAPQQTPNAPLNDVQTGPMLALPAPSFNVGSDGVVMTNADQNAAIQAQLQQQADRQDRINRGEILDVTPIPVAPKLSEQMGIDPNAGTMSAAAAIAVDSGAHQQVVDQQAQQQAVETAQKQGKGGQKNAPTGDLAGAATLAPSAAELQSHNTAFYSARNQSDIGGMIDAANNAANAGADDKQLSMYTGLINRERKDSATPIGTPEQATAKAFADQAKSPAKPKETLAAHSVGSDAANTNNQAQQWDGMSKAERKSVLSTTDIHPIVSNTAWDSISPKVKEKLSAIMQSQDVTAQPAASQRTQQPTLTSPDSSVQAQTPANIKQITAKQIPDMTDAELQQAAAHYGPDHARTAKLNKAMAARGIATNESATTQPEPKVSKSTPLESEPTDNFDNGMVSRNYVNKVRDNDHITVDPQAIAATSTHVKFPEGAEYGDFTLRQKDDQGKDHDTIGIARFAKDGTYTIAKDLWSEPFETGTFDTKNHVESINDVLNKIGEKHPIVNWYNGKPLNEYALNAHKAKKAKERAEHEAKLAAHAEREAAFARGEKPDQAKVDTSPTTQKPLAVEPKSALAEQGGRELVATYRTPRSGKIASEIHRTTKADGSVTYSYKGEYGAGSGQSEDDIHRIMRAMKRHYPNMSHVSGEDFGKTDDKPTSLKEGIAKAQENAKAKTNKPAPQGKKLIGQNAEGQDLFEDKNGIRSVDNGSGFLVGESVAIKPGSSNPYDTSTRTDEHRTVAEIEAAKPATVSHEQYHEDAAKAKPLAVDPLFAKNKLVSGDAVAAAMARINAKMGRLHSGIDPELMADGAMVAAAYIEAGVRSFTDFAARMVAASGDMIKPHLMSFWEGARYYHGLDTTGMTNTADSLKHYQEINKVVAPEMKPVIGEVVKPKAIRTKATTQKGDMVLRQDWGVEYINGYAESAEFPSAEQTDYGLRGGVKDAFMRDAKAYLKAVESELLDKGYTHELDRKGKAITGVSFNEAGPAVSGDISLTIKSKDGANVYVTIGETSLRGMTPSTKSNIGIMFRVDNKGDRYASGGQNSWSPVGLTAAKFAEVLDQRAGHFSIAPIPSQSLISNGEISTDTAENAQVAKNTVIDDELQRVKERMLRLRNGGDPVRLQAAETRLKKMRQNIFEADGWYKQAQEGDASAIDKLDNAGFMDAADKLRSTIDVNTLDNSKDSAQNVSSATSQGKNDGQSTKLGTSGQGTLERVSANDVQETPSERNTGRETTGSSQQDIRGRDGLGEQGLSTRRGVADGSGAIPSTARGKGNTGVVQRGNSGQLDFNDGVDPNQVVTSQNAPDSAFNITADDDIGGGGAKTKFKNNVAAIELLKQLTAEDRPATKDEQKVLAKFVGWGGLSGAFVRDDGSYNKGWEKEAKGLEALLTDEEYKAAVDSSIAAHYTSPEIVRAMWQAVQQMGFNSGRVLEPSVGVGNFFGAMPAGLRAASSLHGVELDHITGGIAKNLYPQAKIKAPLGFQDYTFNDGHFDLVIGNPPFSSMTIHDGDRRAISGFSLHNYFFAKSIDSLREGGVLAMVVTNRLMDVSNASDKARQYMNKHSKLIGAIRLPNNAFLKNAGTEVTTDIIFLQKREAGDTSGHAWMNVYNYVDKQGKSVPLNEYFHRNPQMMLGDFGAYGSMYTPDDPALVARDGQDTAKLLNEAIAKLPAGIMPKVGFQDSKATEQAIKQDISHIKIGSKFMNGDTVMVREPDLMGEQRSTPVEGLSATAVERMKGMIGIRDVLSKLRLAQLTHDATESSLADLRTDLNKAYDAFVKKHGYIHQTANAQVFRDDPSYPQIAALEDSFDKGISTAVAKSTGEVARSPSAKKAAIFSKRTQNPLAVVESVNSAKDAMVESLNRHGNIDLDHMAKLYGKSSDEIVKELGDLIYQDPIDGWVTHDQYLSGNVKQKLAQAKEQAEIDRAYGRNVEALEKVQPEDIEAIDIAVKPGAHWIPRSDIEVFLQHISGSDKPAKASYNKVSSKWTVIDFTTTEASRAQWATDHVSAQSIVEYALAQKQATVYDKHPDGSMSVNQEATIAANTKVNLVAAEWKKWIWDDEERRDRLARLYNDSFNTDVQRAYDGSHLVLPGKVDDSIIRLRPTQINAIWRMVQSESTLADHVVGAGKTFTLIGAAMEMRRMGLAQKPMFVVPNHLVGQWASDFLKLYPNANILAATKKDFEAKNRKKFVARIATGDYDAVIVAHSSFGKIKIDPKEEAQFIKDEIQELLDAEADDRAANGKNSRNAKDYAKRRLTLEEKFKKLVANENKDADNLHWHELGVDALFLDEAHEFKNLNYVTGMQRIAGLGNQKGSQKATDLFMKINSMKNNIAKSKVTFATGTPISNTMAEMYTMQRYLDLPRMKEQGIATFDAWARMFGEIVSDWELSPAGKYKMNSRFSKFANMPELMQRYLSFADVINRDDIARMGTPLNVPLVIGGKPQNIVVERSNAQAEYLGVPTMDDNGNEVYPEGSLIWRSEHLPKKAEKGADNMLKIMSDARKAALDMRLIDPNAADEPDSKVNDAVKRVIELYHKWHADKGTQLIFCDLSTPKGAVAAEKARIEELVRKADEGDEAAIEQLDNLTPDELDALNSAFSVYDDMKQKFIDQGIPEKEIAFIHDAKTDLQKEELFGKVRSGQVRILMGSTAKMGAGMNAQERLVGLHHIDAPWRPSDLEQREGRIIRQGNALRERDPTGFEVAINRYATKQTLDSRMWETLERKAKFIEQVRKGDGKQRVIEDIGGESANSAEMKAASSGNPLILEEMTLRKQVKTLEDDRSQHLRDQHRVQRSLNEARKLVPRLETSIEIGKKELSVPIPKELAITVNGKEYKQGEEGARENAGAALLSVAKTMTHQGKARKIGQYGGFELSVQSGMVDGVVVFELTSPNDRVYDVRITPDNQSPLGLVTKITNLVNDLPSMLAQAEQRLKDTISSIPKLEAQLSVWDKQAELNEAVERHEIVIDQLRPKQKVEDKAAPADTENGDVKFSFAGRRAIGADIHSLDNAKQLIGQGEDAETVRQETGWHRGADAKWRFEISDDQATVKVEGDTAADVIDMAHLEAIADGRMRQTVGDLLDHPQLFAAYPALKDIPVSLMPADVKAEARIQQFATGLEIQLAGNMPRSEIASAILHELQHAIQHREGFAMGGSRKTFISDYDKTGAQTYKRLAGEVEARNTQMRKTMTPRLRSQIAPEDTADTPESKVLISFNGKDVVPSVLPNNSMRPAMTKGGLRSAFEIKFPKLVTALNKMLTRGESGQRGGVVILDSADPLRIAHDFAKKTGTPFNDAIQMFSEDGSINGFYDPKSGLTFLVGPNLDSWTGPAVLLHEMVHGQQRASIDKQALAMLMNRGQVKNKDLSEFLDRVATRMIDAGEVANAQEATAYIVEQAVMEGQAQGFGEADSRFLSWVDSKLGQRVGDLIRSFLRMTRQWMLRNGMPVGNISVSDMVSYAQAGLKRAAKGQVEGKVDDLNNQVAFSRSGVRDIASKATAELNKRFSAPGKLSAWHKTVGTMYNLAERSPAFKPVFTAAQNFIDDVSFYASEAAELAPKILPKLDAIKDITKKPISAEDNKAIAKPIFEGTLLWGRDRDGTPVLVDSLAEAASKLSTERKAQILEATGNLPAGMHKAWKGLPAETYAKMIDSRYETVFLKAGVVWTDDELQSLFSLNDGQVALYHEFRDSANQSLDSMTKAEMLRIGGKDVKDMRDQVMGADNATAASHMLMERLSDIAMTDPDRATSLFQAAQDIKNRVETTVGLQAAGYAPLSRFGKYTVDVVDDGERQYFGLFETMHEANTMAEQLRAEFGKDKVTQGTLSAESYKLFAGITPESLELFGNMLGLESDGDKARDQAFQEYIRLTKNNRSAMKRLIHRKGIAGYSEDVGRVLASFIYSNARQTAGGLHMGDLDEAVQGIPKGQGELTDVAVKLRDYIKNPQEEAQAIRGLLFAQYLGGSIASAMVNMTQPLAVTFPYLSQHGGAKNAAAHLIKAAKQMAGKASQFEPDLMAAMKRAEEDGTLSPQEVHQLMAQARGNGSLKSGDGTRAGNVQALAQNSMTRFSLAWGKLFGAAEQINRRVTFIAAYRIAKEQGMANADEFARHAVKETQFVYSKASKMQWGRGAIGGTLMTFKTYSIAYLELMSRLWNQGEEGSAERKQGRKAAMLMIATLLLLSGAGGLPFADDLNDLIDGLAQIAGYNFSTKKAKQDFLEETFGKPAADFIDKGITGLPGMPLDVAGRMGMGNLLPGTGLLKESNDHTRDVMEVFGPAGDFASRVGQGARQVVSGDVVGGLLQAAPAAFRNAAKGADMATTGMYRDQKGYKVLQTSNLEAAMKAIGFQPSSVADVQEANYLNQGAKAFYNLKAQEIRAQWANGIFLKDPSEVQAARDAITSWNEKNPDQRMIISIASVLKKAKEMNKSKDERIAATAPKAMRQQMREDIAQRRAEALN